MRKKMLAGLLILCLILALAPAASAMTGVKITKKGQVVDSITFKGVTVNAIYAPPDTISNYSSDPTYCCAAFVSKFYREVYGVTVNNLVKNGGGPKVNKGSFSKTTSPQVGDVIHRKTSTSTHWAIVKEVNSKTVTVIEQNAWYSRAESKARVGKTYDINDSAVTFYRYSGAQACNGSHSKGEYQFCETPHPHKKFWKCANCGELFTDGSTTSLATCVTCYPPKQETQIVTISDWGHLSLYYDGNGGTGAPYMEDIKGWLIVNDTYTYAVTTREPTWSGYTFLGWSTNKNATSPQYHAGDTVTVSSATTLYAVWEKNCDNGHSWTEWERAQEATCEAEGQDERVCTVCGKSEIETLPALEHTWDDGVVTKTATETQEGVKTFTCEVCGGTREEPIEKQAHTAHTWGRWEIVQEASCEKTGKRQHTCTVCGKEETERVATLNHQYKAVEDNALYVRYRCTNCGDSYFEEKELGQNDELGTGMSNFLITKQYSDSLFWDVSSSDWFCDNVAIAYEMGLMKGTGSGTFSPGNNVTLAEAITLAARIHSIYYTGTEEFPVYDGGNWYDPYVDYAKENGIINTYYNYTRPATREEFVHILAQALPKEALENIAETITFADANAIIYMADVRLLSGAGVINGIIENGQTYFRPDNAITRAQVAAVVGRMVQPDSRISG